jgi:hypothetical protein
LIFGVFALDKRPTIATESEKRLVTPIPKY